MQLLTFKFIVLSTEVNGQADSTASEQPAVPELVLSLIRLSEQQNQGITDLSLPWAALILLPHLRYHLPISYVRIKQHLFS